MKNYNLNIYRILSFLILGILALSACQEEDEVYEKTRLFRPVLNEDLFSEENNIIVNMGKLKEAVSYTIEVSRDSFKTVEYTIETDTNYVVINEDVIGEELLWFTIYQVRATAHAADPQYNSKPSDLGSVRTQRFPTILNLPASYDVTDVAARLTWTVSGDPVTGIKVFAGSDEKLKTPLFDEIPVSEDDQLAGETIVTGLQPSTKYQLAIYSGSTLRGWVNYNTLEQDIDPAAPGVIDLRDNLDPQAVANAVASAADGSIILVKRGSFYDLPSTALDKSITIRAAHGFGEQKARLYTTGNWNIAGGSDIDHIRFIDLEIRGEDYSGDYVFNPSTSNIHVREILFEKCEIGTLRGILRIRGSNFLIEEYKIINCLVDSIGGYGILTTDTDPNPDVPTARVNDITLKNSTFNKLQASITSRNNSNSITIEGCTFSNFVQGGSGNYIFRYRGSAGNNNVLNGITIKDCLFGPGWDEANSENYAIRGMQGLESTTIQIVNTYSTSNFSFSSNPIPGFPVGNYTKTQNDLWVNPMNNNFNFKDTGFIGKSSAGDPRWRIVL